MNSTINLSPAVEFALQFLIALAPAIAAILTGFIAWALQRFGLKQTAEQGEFMHQRLDALLRSGVNLAKSTLQTKYSGALTVHVHNQLVADVANYVLTHGETVSKYYDFPNRAEILEQKAEAWLASQGLVPGPEGSTTQVPAAVPVPAGAVPVQPRTDIPLARVAYR
jgi:hypothetical protein